jgi:hypothetical protein
MAPEPNFGSKTPTPSPLLSWTQIDDAIIEFNDFNGIAAESNAAVIREYAEQTKQEQEQEAEQAITTRAVSDIGSCYALRKCFRTS